jgi:sphingomyelin phosphodiesterase acid-like 3
MIGGRMYKVFMMIIGCIWIGIQPCLAEVSQSIRFLGLSDLHFDPFMTCLPDTTPCPLIEKLRSASASKWATILSTDMKPAQYGHDSNYLLLNSALTAAKEVGNTEQVKFVLVLGDLLGHRFKTLYKKYSRDKRGTYYPLFVKKTTEFIKLALAEAFPVIDVYVAVGNNDSYGGDYTPRPKGQFLQDMADSWSGLIKNKANNKVFRRMLPVGGYYAVDLPKQTNLHLIVLNSILWSNKVPMTKAMQQAASNELRWLHSELEQVKINKQKALIAMHIPSGVDVYSPLRQKPFRLIAWRHSIYAQRFQEELQQFPSEIVGIFAGHLHADWLQTLIVNASYKIPVSGIPSISPVFGNNPGFKVYRYSLERQRLEDMVTYYSPLRDKMVWQVEYDLNHLYQPNCKSCSIANAGSLLR